MAISTDYNTAAIASNAANTTSSVSNGYNLDMSDFFQILSAQLQNQSMFDTVDNTQYITQMAQFSMLSQMQEMAQNIQSVQALSLMGKTVSLVSINSNGSTSKVSGKVDSVVFQNGTSYVGIDGLYYEASSVYQVSDTEG